MAAAPANLWFAEAESLKRLYVSPHAERMTGHPVERWLQEGFWLDHVLPGDRDAALEQVRRALQSPGEQALDYRFVRADGRVMWVRDIIQAMPARDGRAGGFIGVMSDVTELHAATEALRRSEERMRFILDSARDYAIFTMDLQGRVSSWNPGAESLLGYSEEEIKGKDGSILFTPEDNEVAEAEEEKRRALRSGRSVDERWHLHKSGRRFWGSGLLMPLRNAEGETIGFIKIMRDGTESMRAAERAKQQNTELELRVAERTAQLEAANRELESFSYSVSHDLHAPLRKIDGYSRVILEDNAAQLDEEGRRRFEKIRAASQHMSALIDDLLSLARVVRGTMREEDVDLSAMVLEINADLQRAQPSRSLSVRVTPGLRAKADSHLLRIALFNLLENAWKFTAKTERPSIEVGALAGGDQPVYFVRDNGAGFEMAYAAKLFREFSRLHDSDEFPGTGIGLATVKRIVRRHGGRIWAEGRPGQGATFYFTLGPSRKAHA